MDRSLNGTQLKQLACLFMLADHIGAALLAPAWGVSPASATLPPDSGAAGMVYILLRGVGRLAFPLFCFLLTEGYAHTHSPGRYAARLGLFALISEPVFDWAFFGQIFWPGHQNVYGTLALGMLALLCLDKAPARWMGWLGAVACGLCAQLLATDYGLLGVGLIVGLYLTRQDRQQQGIWGGSPHLLPAARAAGLSADGPLRWAAGPVQPGAAVVLLLVLPAAPAGAGAAGPYIGAALTLPRSVLYRKAACGEKTLHPQ